MKFGPTASFWATIVFNSTMASGIALSAIHTLYRYCTITGKGRLLFGHPRGLDFLIVAVFVYFVGIWTLGCIFILDQSLEALGGRRETIKQIFGIELAPASFASPQYWDETHGLRWVDILAVGYVTGISYAASIFGVVLTYKLHHAVKQSMCSAATRAIQNQLITILLTTLIASTCMEIIPFTLCQFSGTLGIGFIVPVMPILNCLFPITDAVICTFLVKALRTRALRYLGCSCWAEIRKRMQLFEISSTVASSSH